MALCSYSILLSNATPCEQSSDYPGQLECVAVKDCTKDVISHLSSFKLSNDEGVGNEMKLLLARAGMYLFINENPFCDVMNSDACMLNRARVWSLETEFGNRVWSLETGAEFGIRWRTRKTLCAVPTELA